MKITRKQLRRLIAEALEVHRVEEELVGMDPHDAYGSGYLKGKEYHEDNDEIEIDIELKLTVDQIRRLLLREFKFTGQDFVDDLDLLGGGPPPEEESEDGGGGGGGRIHQLVRVNFDPGSEFNPAAYTKTPIDMTPGSPFSKMREIYNSFSNNTKNVLYQMFPGGIDPEDGYEDAEGNFIFDQDMVWEFRSAYTDLLNTMNAAVPDSMDYEYFVIYHPPYASYGGEDGADESKALDLYRSVTGYTPDDALLNEYEIIMHSASAMYG